MVQNSKTNLILLLLGLTFLLSACVPVLVVAVGATAGKSVISDKPTESPKAQDLSVSKPISHDPLLSHEPLAPKQDSNQNTSASQNSISHKESKDPDQLSEKVAKGALMKTPVPESNANVQKVHSLLKNAWKVKSHEIAKNNMVEGILYFDTDDRYYGFDGCKYFKGKFVLDVANQIFIKTLLVSSTGSNECGNKMEVDLFLANSFILRDNELLITNNDKVVLTLTHLDNFNTNEFLRNARLNTQRKSPNSITKTKTNRHPH